MPAIFPVLSAITWLPIIAGCLMLLGARYYKDSKVVYIGGLVAASLTACCIIFVTLNFDTNVWHMQFVERTAWLPNLNIDYGLGVDGFALPLVILTAFMTFMVLILAPIQTKSSTLAAYCATFLIMQGLMCGVFLALDAILFYVFFEAMMIPMFLIIGLWGGDKRSYATLKFILYTFFGSLFLLVAILYLNHVATESGLTGSSVFAINSFQNLVLSFAQQQWLFAGLLIAFAVKIPMWPVHTWLPDAHVEAPTGGSVILAAITLKMGGYGMLRFLLPIAPDACAFNATGVIALSLIAIVYIGLIAIVQLDMKKIIAYSSIAHMGFVTLGLFITFKLLNLGPDITNVQTAVLAVEGSMMQMLSHGLVSGALFICVGVLYTRMHSRLIADYGGVANSMPAFAALFMLFALANVGVPGTSSFVGEFMVILASFKANVWYAFFAATTLVLSVSYTLWMYKRVIYGEIANTKVALLHDLLLPEKLVLIFLAITVIVFGVWPNLILNLMHATTEHFVQQLL